MTYAKRTDATQRAIVAALRQAGCSVESLHRVGRGVPDLLVGRQRRTYLLEVKSLGEQANVIQREWIGAWRGLPVAIVSSVGAALRAVDLEP